MRFSTDLDSLIDTLSSCRDPKRPERRAKGENIRWEERVSDPRRDHYADAVGTPSEEDYDEEHASYVDNHMNRLRAGEEPACFAADNAAALVPTPAEDEWLVRVEDLSGWAELVFGKEPDPRKDPEGIKASFDNNAAEFWTFFQSLTEKADSRPMFAAFRGDLDEGGDWRSSWWTELPRALGLGHLTASPDALRAVALMEYPVSRVLAEDGRVPATHRFAAPTVIDHKHNPYFCPSPVPVRGAPISYGRAVNLGGSGTLVCEVIHRHISYRRKDITAVAVLTGDNGWATVPVMREAHLNSLRALKGWERFGL